MTTPNEYILRNRETFQRRWFDALRIPSISAQAEHKPDMRRMALWLQGELMAIGLQAELIETEGNPLVFAQSPAVPGKPTVLIYGHYDVQPEDPIDQWRSNPFEPEIREGFVYARGADDDKGQSLSHLFGVESLIASGPLPLQVKFIFEGEEEIGSPSLEKFLQSEENRKKIAADTILVSDTDMAAPGQPAITYGLRGILGFDVVLKGATHDLHSGLYGGSVANPAVALCSLLGSLIGADGKIAIPHFYDDVLPLSDAERDAIRARPFDLEKSYGELGLSEAFGEPEFSVMERRGARPTFDINGLTSGYQGEGGKTIIPASASAKVTCRMVPNQDPDQIFEQIQSFLQAKVWKGLTLEVTKTTASSGFVVSLASPYVRAAASGLAKVFGREPLFIRDGGSIPIIAQVAESLHADTVLAGFGVEEDAIHSPNEHYALESFFQGIEASAAILTELGQLNR